MNIAEKVFEVVKTLPDLQAAEILNFVEHLKNQLVVSPFIDGNTLTRCFDELP